MMTTTRSGILVFLALLLSACSYSVHQVHVSDFAPGVARSEGKRITAEATRFIVLGFDDDTDYVDDAYKKLMERCPKGHIQGITTQYSTAHGFFSWTNKIRLQGLCVGR